MSPCNLLQTLLKGVLTGFIKKSSDLIFQKDGFWYPVTPMSVQSQLLGFAMKAFLEENERKYNI